MRGKQLRLLRDAVKHLEIKSGSLPSGQLPASNGRSSIAETQCCFVSPAAITFLATNETRSTQPAAADSRRGMSSAPYQQFPFFDQPNTAPPGQPPAAPPQQPPHPGASQQQPGPRPVSPAGPPPYRPQPHTRQQPIPPPPGSGHNYRVQQPAMQTAPGSVGASYQSPPEVRGPQKPPFPDLRSLKPLELQQWIMDFVKAGFNSEAQQVMQRYLEFRSRHVDANGYLEPALCPSPSTWDAYFMSLSLSRATLQYMLFELKKLRDVGCKPSAQVYAAILKRCAESPRDNMLGKIAYTTILSMKEEGYNPPWNCYTWAIRGCVTANEVDSALRLLAMFQASPVFQDGRFQKQVSDLLNSMVPSIVKAGQPDKAVQLLDDMMREGFVVAGGVFQELVALLSDEDKGDLLLRVVRMLAAHQDVKTKKPVPAGVPEPAIPMKVDTGSCLAMLNSAARCGHVELAVEVWGLLERSLKLQWKPHIPGTPQATPQAPPISAFHALIHTHANAQNYRGLFTAMRKLRDTYPQDTVCCQYTPALQMVVDSLARNVQRIDQAYYELENLKNKGEQLDSCQVDCIIAACGQAGDLGRAFETFDAFGSLGLIPDINTYNALIQACSRNGRPDSIDKLLTELQATGLVANALTHALVVDARVMAKDLAGMVTAVEDARVANVRLPVHVIERCIARCCREGDEDAFRAVASYLLHFPCKVSTGLPQVKRWEREGGMAALTGSRTFKMFNLLRSGTIPTVHLQRYIGVNVPGATQPQRNESQESADRYADTSASHEPHDSTAEHGQAPEGLPDDAEQPSQHQAAAV